MKNILQQNIATLRVAYDEGAFRNLGTLSDLFRLTDEGNWTGQPLTNLVDAFKVLTPEMDINVWTSLTNVLARQVIITLARGWKNPLSSRFVKDAVSFGEYVQHVVTNINPLAYPKFKYEPNSLKRGDEFIIKPDIRSTATAITDTPQFAMTINRWEVRRCFMNERTIDGYFAETMSQIDVVYERYMYDYALDLIKNGVVMDYVIKKGTTTDEKTQEIQNILEAKELLKQPTTEYNEDGAYTRGTLDPFFLINLKTKLDFTTKVDAKIFGPEYVQFSESLTLPFKKQLGVDSENSGIIGYIVDTDKLVIVPALKEMLATYPNARTGNVNYILTTFIERGSIPQLNGIRLVEADDDTASVRVQKPVITKGEVSGSNTEFTISKRVANGEIWYTTDGSDPFKADGTIGDTAQVYKVEYDNETINPEGVLSATSKEKPKSATTAGTTVKAVVSVRLDDGEYVHSETVSLALAG